MKRFITFKHGCRIVTINTKDINEVSYCMKGEEVEITTMEGKKRYVIEDVTEKDYNDFLTLIGSNIGAWS